MSESDEIEQAVALAEAETGARGGVAKLRLCLAPGGKERSRRWTAEEDAYVRESRGRLTEGAIAAHLGRSVQSVHLRAERELHLVAPSKSPEILTAEHVSMGLGTDGKSVAALMDRGLMPHRRLPGKDVTRVIDRRAFLLWLLNPVNWCYFKADRVGAMRPRGKRGFTGVYDFAFWEDAREVLAKARKGWKDEWLTPGQCSATLGLTRKGASHNVNRAVLKGNLKGTRWGNWWIRRSDLPAGMTVNAAGKLVKAGSIKPVRCGRCGGTGHNMRLCGKKADPRSARWSRP